MASTSGEFSVVHYFDAEKNELMFVRFWVNGHEVLMPLSELVYGLKDGKDIEVVIPEDTSEENKLVNMIVNMNEVLEAIGRLQEVTTLAVANRKAVEATRKKALEESKKNFNLKDTAEIEGVEPGTDTEEIKVSETKKLNKVQEAENV